MKNLLCFISFIFVLNSLFAQDKTSGPSLILEEAFPNLNFPEPTDLKSSTIDSKELFIVEKSGKIYRIDNSNTTTEKKLFLDISQRVLNKGECGLLGLAFHPDFKKNRYFYVNYTTPDPIHTIIARFEADPKNPQVGLSESFVELLKIRQPFTNHNGGQVIFGPDKYLYIGMGDGGSQKDPKGNGQNLSVLLGKMLRIDVNTKKGDLPYGIPPSNPFANNQKNIREEIYAYGLRNPWRFSFDKETKKMWCGDVGQNAWEEINIITLGGNFGWNAREGKHDFTNVPVEGKLIDPVFEYEHGKGDCSITGGFVYNGNKIKSLKRYYIYSDYCSRKIWKLNVDTYENSYLLKAPSPVNSFGEDNQGELFVLCSNGKIYQFKE